jgi:hypothetical protein
MKSQTLVKEAVGPAKDRLDTFEFNDGAIATPVNGSVKGRVISEFCPQRLGAWTAFELIPATSVAAGSDKLTVLSGTSTEVIARVATGGVRLTTQASTPADDDNVMLAAAANSYFNRVVTATSRLRFVSRVKIPTITSILASVGLNENLTDPDPTGSAGEGAMFLFDPDETVTTGLTSAQHDNWILAHKVNGTDTFTATSIPVVADQDYVLEIEIDEDLKANFYINGEYVGIGPALTSGDTVAVYAGCETNTAGQRSLDVRYLGLAAEIG